MDCSGLVPHGERLSPRTCASSASTRRELVSALLVGWREELANCCCHRCGLVEREEGIAIVYLDVFALGEESGESSAVVGWHDTIIFGPDDEGSTGELGELFRDCDEDRAVFADCSQDLRGVTTDS